MPTLDADRGCNLPVYNIIAECLSARHLILLRFRIAFVCMYVCMSVTLLGGAVSISDCACLLHAEVRVRSKWPCLLSQ